MTKTFTHNELLQYVYNELADEVTNQLECALQTDHLLAESCAELLVSKGELEMLSLQPSRQSISNILMYSQSLNQQIVS